jgi:hypothetical protein
VTHRPTMPASKRKFSGRQPRESPGSRAWMSAVTEPGDWSGLKHEAEEVYRADIVPMGRSTSRDTYVKAPRPVMARPTMSVCMVSVPSKVWIASMSTMCRMTW